MSVILIIRHAEKPDAGRLGVDESGSGDEQSLIVRGWQRAGALVGLFAGGGPLPAPDRIFASGAVKLRTTDGKIGSRSKRPLQTVSVLAARLDITVDVSFVKGQETALASHIAALGGTTLVSWQHEMIPAIATALRGSGAGLPASWPAERFDVAWRLARVAPDAPWSFDQVCQRLLPGDASQPL